MRDQVLANGMCKEGDCTIEHQGKTFQNDGAFIGMDKSGKYVGVVYGDWNKHQVTNWHGDVTCPATYGPEYRSNFGDKRLHVWFTWKGIKFHGMWANVEWNQLIRVREVK